MQYSCCANHISKMKYALLFILFGFASAWRGGFRIATQTLTEALKVNLLQLEFDRLGLVNKKDNCTIDRFMDELSKANDCADNIDFGTDSVCVISQTKAPACYENFIVLLEGCLEGTQIQDLPRLFRDILTSITRGSCESTGEQVIELNTNPCFVYGEISRQVGELARSYDLIQSRADFCRALLNDKDTMIERVKEMCPGDVAREAGINFVNSIMAPCT